MAVDYRVHRGEKHSLKKRIFGESGACTRVFQKSAKSDRVRMWEREGVLKISFENNMRSRMGFLIPGILVIELYLTKV